MKKVSILRTETDEFGTFGKLKTGTFECYTLERPMTGEFPCIPAGTYTVEWRSAVERPTKGPCYEIVGVKDRTAILIHSANWFQQLLGCIAPGRSIQVVGGFMSGKAINQKGVTSSKDAVAGLETDLSKEPFELTVSWTDGVGTKEAA